MESIGQLTGGLAHDFNNYLAVVIGNLDLLADCQLRRSRSAQADRRRACRRAARRRADAQPAGVLAPPAAQPQEPRCRPARQRRRAAPEAHHRREDHARRPGRAGTVAGRDRRRAARQRHRQPRQQCARRHARWRHADAQPCAMPRPGGAEQPAGDHVLIEMIDTGRGMDEATQARAFEPFFSTKGPGHGTGLGLSMVHGFVHQSGGTIRLQSAKGKGTTVQLFLPRAARPVARSAPAGAALPRGTESVLVVEDNVDVRAMVVAQVKSLGYRVAEADSGDAAVALLEERPGRVRPPDLRHGHAGRDRRPGAGQDGPAALAEACDPADDGLLRRHRRREPATARRSSSACCASPTARPTSRAPCGQR